MNIFVLHLDPVKAAKMHCDKHAVKMPVETAQLLSNVFHINRLDAPYRACHMHHPCTLWAAQSSTNFLWLAKLGIALCEEYTRRYGKQHKCQQIIQTMIDRFYELQFSETDGTPFPLCMPEEYRCADAIRSYRAYYIHEKSYFAKWKYSRKPSWFNV